MTPLLLAALQLAASGQIVHAQLETRTLARPLAEEVRTIAARGQAAWIGYRVPTTRGAHRMCGTDAAMTSPVLLEPPDAMTILIRVEGGAITALRTVTPDCAVDAGGLPVVALDAVGADDSAAWLASLIGSGGTNNPASATSRAPRRGLVDQALAALAFHAGEPATRTLVSTARNDSRPEVRSRALFWLGQRAGNVAASTISAAVDDDPDIEVKKKAVFALSQLPADEAVPKLIELARSHREPQVRKQAMFWLGQTKDPRAIAFFEEILRTTSK
jgi:hypothetical protein